VGLGLRYIGLRGQSCGKSHLLLGICRITGKKKCGRCNVGGGRGRLHTKKGGGG